MPLDWQMVILANVCVCVGAAIQSTIGYGMALVALPLLLAIDPELVPGPLLVANLALVMALTAFDRGHIERRTLAGAPLASLPGVLVGSVALSWMQHRTFVVFTVVVLVLTTVFGSRRRSIAMSARNLAIAGFTSGFCGTTTSINGPPLAAVMVGSRKLSTMRATLAAFLFVSTVLSLVGLGAVGRFNWQSLVLAFMMIPGVMAGLLIARTLLYKLAAKVEPKSSSSLHRSRRLRSLS